MTVELLPVKSETVVKLKALLDDGQFAVPRLQRVFVWNGSKAAKLLDSIYRGMPIGALTVWDTSKKNQHLLRHEKDSVLPSFHEANARVWFVLDGQQRLSVLYRVQAGGIVTNGRHQQVDFSRVVFRITDGDEQDRFAYRKAVPGEWIPVCDLMADNWQRRISSGVQLSARQMARAEKFRVELAAYRVPLVRVSTESIDDAREMFIRINAAGTPIAAADKAFARAAEFDLREQAEQAWTKLPPNFRGLKHETLLQTRALLDGIDEVGASAMERVAEHWNERIREKESQKIAFAKIWKQQRAAGRALDLLQDEFRVLDDSLLPSQYMVSTLSVFYAYRPKTISNEQLLEVRKWFWATALGQRYSGRGFSKNILDDARFFRGLAEGTRKQFRLAEQVDIDVLRRATYGHRSSVTDAFLCMLIAQRPQSFTNGRETTAGNVASLANRTHRHHIFPRKHLQDEGNLSERAINSILNLCIIPAEDNSRFGAKPPRKYLVEHVERPHFRRVMVRHLIPHDEGSGVWQPNSSKGYMHFLREREVLVVKEFERLAGAKLFRRGSL